MGAVMIGKQSDHMGGGLIFFDMSNPLLKSIIFEKSAIGNGVGNINRVLFYHATGTQIDMTRLTIPFLAFE